MKRIGLLVAVAALLLLVGLPARSAWAFGVKDVVAMHRDGVPDSLIIMKIRHSDAVFHLNAKDLRLLQDEGVSDRVVGAMLRTEDRDRYYGYGGWYDPWYYDPWAPRLVLGFDYGFGPAFGPRFYRPFYGRPFAGRFSGGFHRAIGGRR